MSPHFRILLLGGLLAGSAPAFATTFAPLTQDQITDAADAVIRGTVVSVRTELVNDLVWTHADVQVERVYKGVVNAEVITLEALGGSYGGQVFDVDGAARYSVGEELIAFVTVHPSRGTWGTVGMFHGKYTIRQNPADGLDMVVRFALPYSVAYDARFVPAPDAKSRVSLASFEASILNRVELGWDGKPIPGVSPTHLRQINRLQTGVR